MQQISQENVKDHNLLKPCSQACLISLAGLPVLSHKEAQLFLQRMAQLNRTGNLEVMRDVWESVYLDLLHRLCSSDSPVQPLPTQVHVLLSMKEACPCVLPFQVPCHDAGIRSQIHSCCYKAAML